jgi:Fe-S cluster assembly protein SufD
MTVLPTRRVEAWRYSDHAAVAKLWPVGPATVVEVGPGESDTRILLADQGGIHDYQVTLATGARLDFQIVNTGTRYSRIAIDVTLHDSAHFELGAVQIGGGDTVLEIVTTVRHIAPNASSRQTVRIVLDDRATGSYLGKVAVARDAQKTDAVQSVKALLLKRTATANLKPELEIYADDVKCAHGATVGELSKEALFYLESRGIAPDEAQALLTEAFIGDAITDEALLGAALASLRFPSPLEGEGGERSETGEGTPCRP